jgi:hypothetical protein
VSVHPDSADGSAETGLDLRVVGFVLAGGSAFLLAALTLIHFAVLDGEPLVQGFEFVPHITLFGGLAAGIGALAFLAAGAAGNQSVKIGVEKLRDIPEADRPDILAKIWTVSKIVQFGLVDGALVVAGVFFVTAADYLALAAAVVLLIVLLTKIPARTEIATFVNEQFAALGDRRRTTVT